MPYITSFVTPTEHQLTLDDVMFGYTPTQRLGHIADTRTIYCDTLSEKFREKYNLWDMISVLSAFNTKYADLIAVPDKKVLYYSFAIPKRGRGLRPIDAPLPELMAALRELKDIFELKLYAMYHTSAYAYIRKRSALDSVKRHQLNNSRWFLKTDFSNFFGNTTPEFIASQLEMIFPFSELMANEMGRKELYTALSLCILNNGLPQGTPISPMLTNLVMIPCDHEISKMCREHSPHLLYTRYADDILISSQYHFDYEAVRKEIMNILRSKFNAPYTIKPEKTRYGSSSGRNWNLGVMLNKDNDITIGHARKRELKVMLYKLLIENENGITWSPEDAMRLNGLLNYYRQVERENIDHIVSEYETKFGRNIEDLLKNIINITAYGRQVS